MAATQTRWEQLTTGKLPYIFDFLDFCKASSGAIVRTLTSATLYHTGAITVGSPVVAATEVSALISGGADAVTYVVRCHGVFTDGAEHDIEITVTTAAPAAP